MARKIYSFEDRMRGISTEFAKRATELSQSLENAVKYLNSLPGKMAIQVSDGAGNTLSFERITGEWVLFYHEQNKSQGVVTELPITLKAKAATLLPALFADLLETSEQQLAIVSNGLEALKSIPNFSEFNGGGLENDEE